MKSIIKIGELPFQREIFARTLFGEARGEGMEGQSAVGEVILNRLADDRWPSTLAGVCLQPWQFSCWNDKDPNRPFLLSDLEGDQVLEQCRMVSLELLFGSRRSYVGRSNHFVTKEVYGDKSKRPDWAIRTAVTCVVGNHVFFDVEW